MYKRQTDGFFVRRRNSSRARLLKALAPLFASALEPSEVIRFVARGYLYSAAEFLLSGHLAAMHTNQTALVLTDRRLLWIQVDSKGRPKDLKNQVKVERIRRVTSRWSGQWILETLAREKLVFNSIPRADRSALVSLIPGSPTAPRDPSGSVEHLCPVCVHVVPGPVGSAATCPNPACRIPFRSPKRAAWLSALVPGVGDIYLRHFAFGTLEFVGSIVVLCVALFAASAAFVSRDSESVAVAATLAFFFVVVPRLFDFALTLHMGRKGIVPLTTTPAPAGIEEGAPIGPSRGRPLPAFPAWSWALFVLGALSVAATGWYSWSDAKIKARIVDACRLAETGKIAEATKLYDEVSSAGPIGDNDRGRFALALWEGGDLYGGDRLVDGLGQIDKQVADQLNAFVAKHQAATGDLEEGRKALVEGEDEAAWVPLDRAVKVFAAMETAPLPKSRHDIVVELAGELLGPPLTPQDLATAVRLTALAGTLPGADARLDVARLRIGASGGQRGEAKALAARVDTTTLDPLWRLLALESSAVLAEGEAEAAAIAHEAEAIPLDRIRLLSEGYRVNARSRRGALLLFGGRADRIAAADLETSREMAAAQGWTTEPVLAEGEAR